VFKRRFDGQEPAQFRNDGLGNLYHVGCLTKVSPIRVVHATPPNAKVDTGIGAWTHWGLLTEVEYSSTIPPVIPLPPGPVDPGPVDPGPGPGQAGQAIVNTQQTGLRLRKEPSLSGGPICEMPKGSLLTVIDQVIGWTKVRYTAPSGMLHIGWCSTDYLRFL